MLRCRAAGDISGRKERRHKHPSIVQNPFGAERVDRCGDIGARPDSAQPSLLHRAGESLRGAGACQMKGFCDMVYAHHVAGRAQHLNQLGLFHAANDSKYRPYVFISENCEFRQIYYTLGCYYTTNYSHIPRITAYGIIYCRSYPRLDRRYNPANGLDGRVHAACTKPTHGARSSRRNLAPAWDELGRKEN